MNYPKMKKIYSRNPVVRCLGDTKSEKFLNACKWREEEIIEKKGDNELTRKVLNKYKYYFDDEKGDIFGYDVKTYKNLILAEIEENEKKIKKNIIYYKIIIYYLYKNEK